MFHVPCSMKLSLCVATFNEESNIHYTLDSAYDFVDEVIIVDGGSTDKTVEKAKSYGPKVKIFVESNPAMFHINKQKAIERAKGEWILQLDADESLSPGLKEEIRQLVKNSEFRVQNSESKKQEKKILDSQFNSEFSIHNSKFVAFWISRKNWFLTRFLMKGGQYPDYTIRLYRNGTVRFPCKDVHESVELILNIKDSFDKSQDKQISKLQIKDQKEINNETMEQSNNETIGYLKNPILHYADPTFSRYLQRWDRYTTLEANQLVKLQTTNYKLQSVFMFLDYFIIKPKLTFFSMYFRHKGFMDGFPGFVFALFSSIRFWVIYIKLPTLSKSSRFLTKLYQTMSLRGGGTTTKQSH